MSFQLGLAYYCRCYWTLAIIRSAVAWCL